MRLVFVHGACVRDADWWWHRMTGPLSAAGITSTAVELPSCGPEPAGDLHADADAVRAALTGEPTVLVGHSYGGMVITDAAAGRTDVIRLLYVSSMLPDDGESLAELASGPGWLAPAGPGVLGLRPDVSAAEFHDHFTADCDPDLAAGAMERTTRQSATAFGQTPRGIGWREIPATAVICATDLATPPDRQRTWARRAEHVVEIPTGHHPFLARPELLAELITAEAAR